MRTLLRNFFYAVGLVLIAFLYTSNPDEIQLRDIALLVQSNMAQQLTFLLTLVIAALEFMFGFSYTRSLPAVGVAVAKGSAPFRESAASLTKDSTALKC